MKKLLALALALCLLLALGACGTTPPADTGSPDVSNNETPEVTPPAPEETYKIGVIMYMWTDAQGANIQRYCEYLQENMNVEFVYESTFYDDDAHVGCVENLISAGCDAIISGYDTNIIAAMDTAEAAGVYYAVALDYIAPEDFGDNAISEFFLGGTQQFGGDTMALGATYAQAVIDSGVTNVGGVSFPPWAFNEAIEIYIGFQSALAEAGITASDLAFSSGFTPDEVQAAAQGVMNENPGLEALFGMASGLDYVYPLLQGTDIKLISMGYDDSVESLMNDGALIAAGNNNHMQSIASCVARIVNALEGNSYSDAASGAYNKDGIVNGVASYHVIGNAQELADYLAYVLAEDQAKGSVTVDELKDCIISHNPNATLAALNALTNRTVAEIKAAR